MVELEEEAALVAELEEEAAVVVQWGLQVEGSGAGVEEAASAAQGRRR